MEIADEVRRTIRVLLQRPIAFNPAFVKITGSINAGLLLSQLYYWSDKGKDPEWVYKTIEEIESETMLTRREQDTARRQIKASGVCEIKLKGLPATLHYRINLKALHSAIARLAESDHANQFGGTSQTSLAECAKLDWRNAPNILKTESTTENTTDINTSSSELAKPPVSEVEEWADSPWLLKFLKEQTTFNGHHLPRLMNHDYWADLSETTNGLAAPFVTREFAKMSIWLRDNPRRAPTPVGIRRFVSGWLQRAYEHDRRFSDGKKASAFAR